MNLQEDLNLPFPLRPYQEEGFNFLTSTQRGLLGDDMGLGKTIQTIVALKSIYKSIGAYRCMIVVPKPLISNWIREIESWFPEAHVVKVAGPKKNRDMQFMHVDSILICTYEQMRLSFSADHPFRGFKVVVFDEAQRLKNNESYSHISAKYIDTEKLWLLTGTPLENSLDDLKNIMSYFESNIFNDFDSPEKISNKIKPFMIRRLKEDVLTDLPDLIEENKYIDMTKKQRQEYEEIYEQRNLLNVKDSSSLLSLISSLKMACNFAPNSEDSAKLNYLTEIIDELYLKGEKIIVFSQYVKTLEKIKKFLDYDSMIYHGQMKIEEKDAVIEDFKEKNGFSLLLMSLKAGGVGLNLQEASTVIMFDRWWNPAVESQAIARAHRMGNKNVVHAIKFVTSDSIEEKILSILHEKKELFDFVIDNEVNKSGKENLLEILNLSHKTNETELKDN